MVVTALADSLVQENADAMDELVYETLATYFNVLEKTGYLADNHTYNLLVLLFYKEYIFNDYRGYLTKEDYKLIEKALDCLYGNTCLIPYPDYLKMGKLHLGEATELACRLKTLEDTEVLKEMQKTEILPESDIVIIKQEFDEQSTD